VSERALGTPLAREGLRAEIARTVRLRAIGAYLRERLDPSATLLVPDPGVLAYLSRRTTYDLLGRATPEAHGSPLRARYGAPRADLGAALAREADYVVPFDVLTTRAPRMRWKPSPRRCRRPRTAHRTCRAT